MTEDLDGRASIKREIPTCECRPRQSNFKDCAIPGADQGMGRRRRRRKEGNGQGDGSVIADVHVLSESKPVLSLEVAKCDEGGAATTRKT